MYGRPIPAVNPFWGRPALANGRGRGGAAAVFATAEPTVITPLVYPSHPVYNYPVVTEIAPVAAPAPAPSPLFVGAVALAAVVALVGLAT